MAIYWDEHFRLVTLWNKDTWSQNDKDEGWPLTNGRVDKQLRAYLYRQRCNWGGTPLLFLTAFTFPSSEVSQAPITLWVNRKNLTHKLFWNPGPPAPVANSSSSSSILTAGSLVNLPLCRPWGPDVICKPASNLKPTVSTYFYYNAIKGNTFFTRVDCVGGRMCSAGFELVVWV